MAEILRNDITDIRKQVIQLRDTVKPLRPVDIDLRLPGQVALGLTPTTALTPTTEMSDFN